MKTPVSAPLPAPLMRPGAWLLTLLTLLLAPAGTTWAQAWSAATAGSNNQLYGNSIITGSATDAAGNVFVSGYFNGQVAFGSTTLTGNGDNEIFVAKYVPGTGTWAWAISGGGDGNDSASGIAVSGSSIYVVGAIENNTANSQHVLFGGTGTGAGQPQAGATSTSSQDLVLLKYTDAGTSAVLNWAQVAGGTGVESGLGVAVSGPSVYVTGFITNDRANTNGVVFGGAGTTPGTTTQAGASTTSSHDIVLAKYTDQGSSAALSWTQVGGGTEDDQGLGVAVSGSSVYLTGFTTNNSLNFNAVVFGGAGLTAGTVQQNGASFSFGTLYPDIVVAKYTDQGSTAALGWTQIAGGSNFDMGQGIAVSGTSVYVTGYISNNAANRNGVVFGGSGTTAGTVQVNGTATGTTNISDDIVLVKYTDAGTSAALGWTQVGGGSFADMGQAIAVSGTSVYVSGYFYNDAANTSAVVFGGSGTTAGTVPQNGASSVAGWDQVVARYTDNGATATLNWTQAAGGIGDDYGYAVAVSAGKVYAGGFVRKGDPIAFGAALPLPGTISQRSTLGQLNAATGAWEAVAASSGGGASVARATAADAAGNVFVAGYFVGKVAFGNTTLTSLGGQDLFVAKYVPATATWAWAQRGGGTGDDQGLGVAVRGSSVYLTGYLFNNAANANGALFSGASNPTGTAGQAGASSAASQDIVVAKYTDAGSTATLGWTQVAGGTGADQGLGIAVSNTSVYLTGYLFNNAANANGVLFGGTGTTAGTAGQAGASSTASQDLVVAKYTDAGSTATLGWTQVGGGTGPDYGAGIAVSGTGVYVTGTLFNNTANANGVLFGGAGLAPGTAPQHGASGTASSDVVVARYTDQGSTATLGWTQVGGGTGFDQGLGIATNGTSVYLTGTLENNTLNRLGVLFGGSGTVAGTVPQYGASSTVSPDILVAKYTDNTTSGTLGWTQVGGGAELDQGYGIALNGSNLYVTGCLSNNTTNANGVLFGGTGPTAGTVAQNGTSSSTSIDLVVARYTDLGPRAGLGWTQVGGGVRPDFGYGIAVSGTSVYATGYVYPVAAFGSYTIPGTIGGYTSVLAQLLDTAPTPLAAAAAHSAHPLTLYPNPTHSSATLMGADAGTQVRVCNVLGQLVATATADAAGTATLPAGLAAGVYVVTCNSQALRLAVE